MEEVDSLGHTLGSEGVRFDPKNIQVMWYWLQLKTLKSLRVFLGLASYYRKIFSNYGCIAEQLTKILNKNSFLKNETSQ